MKFFYQFFENSFVQNQVRSYEIPPHISANLKYEPRPYQKEAFKRYLFTEKEEFDEKPDLPLHLLFNMATGSGKTLVMAGLILHLFERGYRNFLFFVNSSTIIEKTKENFLNATASKYLFRDKISINGKDVRIKSIDNFDEADEENINIKFVSIQKLTSDLLLYVKENGLSFEDFENRKIVLIGDEAHHNNAEVWGDLVEKIHQMNYKNILLEFTATLDYASQKIVEKYSNKVIYRYDLAQFRLDKYSKEINLLRSRYDKRDRIIQALLLNLYRQDLATSHYVNLKPVMLLKSKLIKDSKANEEEFYKLIDDFSADLVEHIRKTSTVPIVQKAFTYFDQQQYSDAYLSNRIKETFQRENCLSANNDKDAEENQILLNTLEDENNPVRVIFAVQKLNEGWDVLNLFDIVRLYETRDGRKGKPGKTTLSEAQLIGRGARYFPFQLNEEQEKYQRKHDDDRENDLKVLEELYYHTLEDSKYISELKKALVETGVYEDEDNLVEKPLRLKKEYKKSAHYQHRFVFQNKKIPRSFENITSFEDLDVRLKNHRFVLSSGVGRISSAFFEMETTPSNEEVMAAKAVALTQIPKHIIRFALSCYPFFHFNNLQHYFPGVKSISNFIENKDFLGGLEITFKATPQRFKQISNVDLLTAIKSLLEKIEEEIKANSTTYEGSNYIKKPIYQVFKDKVIRVRKEDERADGQEELVANEPWYVYNANYGTSEEKKFVELFQSRFEQLNQKYRDIYLIRNERELAVYDKKGRRFEPDFVLFCTQKTDGDVTYQVFIEPKGNHLKGIDQWKEDFLLEMRATQKTIDIHTDTYLITGVPFYNFDNENEFKKELEKTLV